ncbi:MAG: RNA-binding protein [Dehalococcoidia bacterium]
MYVGNMSYDASQSEIEGLFSEAGEVTEVSLPVDRNTGRPRGFAFVEFADEAACAHAIEKFDGHELHGRTIRVNEAEKPRERTQSFGDSRQFSRPQQGQKPSKPKGSRRNIRAKKRGF